MYEIVERWESFAKRRRDVFGFIDILVVDERMGTVGIQATTVPHRKERADKIALSPKAETWLKAGNGLEIWSWSKHRKGWKVHIDLFYWHNNMMIYQRDTTHRRHHYCLMDASAFD